MIEPIRAAVPVGLQVTSSKVYIPPSLIEETTALLEVSQANEDDLEDPKHASVVIPEFKMKDGGGPDLFTRFRRRMDELWYRPMVPLKTAFVKSKRGCKDWLVQELGARLGYVVHILFVESLLFPLVLLWIVVAGVIAGLAALLVLWELAFSKPQGPVVLLDWVKNVTLVAICILGCRLLLSVLVHIIAYLWISWLYRTGAYKMRLN